ncbi:MAG: TolC family protein [Raineya sp.]|nr:TolC family protein [Raineya sp.]
MKYIYSFLCVFLLFTTNLLAQDTLQVFSLRDLYAQMLRHHPIVKRIDLHPRIAQEEIRIARGNFDPKLEVDYFQKTFKDKFYYSYWDSRLKAPIWIGELKIGYELNEGELIDSESKSPDRGLLYAGISVPIGQNLLIDARRAILRQAQVMQEVAQAERIKELNKLFFSATKDYWEWYARYNELRFIRKGYELAEERYNFVKQLIQFGEAAGIDSVEAKITLQERTIQLRQAEIDFRNAGLMLSVHLWRDGTPVELPENAIPETITQIEVFSEARLNELLEFAQQNHPEIQKIRLKLNFLDIERRFQVDRIKPRINLHYNVLTAYNPMKFEMTPDYFANNYKVGLDASFPLFLRKERGKVFQTRFKINQTEFEQTQLTREILTQVRTAYNELKLMEQNLLLQEDIVKNQQKLRDAEQQRFVNGESSVFLINARESKLIDLQVKLVALQAKYEKAKVMLRWAAGERFWEQ